MIGMQMANDIQIEGVVVRGSWFAVQIFMSSHRIIWRKVGAISSGNCVIFRQGGDIVNNHNDAAPRPTTKELIVMLSRHRRAYGELMNTLYSMATYAETTEEIDKYLQFVESANDRLSEYLYETLGATIGTYDEREGKVYIDSMPPGIRMESTENGFIIKNLPKWLLGHSAAKKYPPLYHQNQPFVRKRQLWYWLIRKLKEEWQKETMGDSVQMESAKRYAHMAFVYRSAKQSDFQDIDHYVPAIEPFVNALRANRLIQSDASGKLSLEFYWMHDNTVEQPVIDIKVSSSDEPMHSEASV